MKKVDKLTSQAGSDLGDQLIISYYFILLESFIILELSEPIILDEVSVLIIEEESEVAGGVDIMEPESLLIAEESVPEVFELPPQAAKVPIAKTNKSFFIVVNVLCE